MDKPRITAEELAAKLVSSRKIMNKVDTGDYEIGNIDKNLLESTPEQILEGDAPRRPPTRPIGKADPDKINQSRLPDAIKRAMIDNPIPEISMNEGLDMDLVSRTRKLMEADGSIPVSKTVKTQNPRQVQTESRQELSNDLATLIESTIRKVLDEKLTQILNAQEAVSINENLVIKVGESLFSGKITKVKSSK